MSTVGGMNVREASHIKKIEMLWTFSVGGGTQLHSIAFGGVFPYITEPILDDGNINKCPN